MMLPLIQPTPPAAQLPAPLSAELASQADYLFVMTQGHLRSLIGHLGEAKRLKKENPDRVVGVGGCWSHD